MADNKYKVEEDHIRHVMLFQYNCGHNARTSTANINEIYPDSLDVRKCQRWFNNFRRGNFDLQNAPKSGRPVQFDEDELRAVVEEDPTQTIEEISQRTNTSWASVQRHLKSIGKFQHSGKWVPYNLSDSNKSLRSSICRMHLNRHEKEPFFDCFITADEKWIMHDNTVMRKQWLSTGEPPRKICKPNIHGSKNLLCVWWNIHGVVHFEILKAGETITAQYYCDQLDRLKAAIAEKHPALLNRKNVILHHDNARPHVARMTRSKLKELGWETFTHPAYSPDLAPSDFHLFRSLQQFLNGKILKSYDDVKNTLFEYFNSKNPIFFKTGIENLISRWRKVIELDGDYFVD